MMNRDSKIIMVLNDPAVILKSNGELLEVNPPAARLLDISSTCVKGRFLREFTTSAADEVQRYLRLCARNRQMVFGSLRLRRGGEEKTFSCKGAVLEPAAQGETAVLFLQFFARHKAGSQFVELEQRIQALNAEIRKRKQVESALDEANKRKDEFLATLAHELRNPLAPIANGIELIKKAAGDRGVIDKALPMMERQMKMLIMLVNDLLDISRITRGRLQLKKRQMALSELIELVLESVSPVMEKSKQSLEVGIPDERIFLTGDLNRLSQVISNLLNNAAKYTPPGGCIRLSAAQSGGTVVISVADNGIGIPIEMQERIFELFTQVNRPQERGYSGLGIGLTLAKTLVEWHGGSIEVESGGQGEGSTFRVKLPILSEGQPEDEPKAIPEEAPARPSPKRVLVVDDNRDSAETLRMVIEMLGNQVRMALNGEEACRIAAEFLPDLILMDLGMPLMNGYEAARYIRGQSWGKKVRLVALSGWSQEEDRRKTAEAGFDEHLTKPLDGADMRALFLAMEERTAIPPSAS